ncbi:hypothetical protein KP509_03G002700 [Ceratopteris richardii]|uniref:Uncharacterized protein n=1 Tax=Ceratopteris richardii TaxID=49495 RepID=A0A8T2UWM4_CERRI|nr:hypothetical protein KP509_03G002700 [Ceratopteris richardii]
MTYITLGKQESAVVLPKGIKSGLSHLTLLRRKVLLFHNKDSRTKVVNKTGSKIVMRTKYRDVWEGPSINLGPGESTMMVGSKLMDPNQRLAVLLSEQDESCLNERRARLLIIPSHIIASNREIQIVRSSSKRYGAVPSGSKFVTA